MTVSRRQDDAPGTLRAMTGSLCPREVLARHQGHLTQCEAEGRDRSRRIVGIGGGTNAILTILAAKHLGEQT
jgi:hypothetical protein